MKLISVDKEFSITTTFIFGIICVRGIISSYFLPKIVNGEIYRNFCEDTLLSLLQDIPLRCGEILIAVFLIHKLNGRGRQIPWPLQSLDLTLINFLLWGHKEIIYFSTLVGGDDIFDRIHEAIANINIYYKKFLSGYRSVFNDEGSSFIIK